MTTENNSKQSKNSEEHFRFGKNWKKYLGILDEKKGVRAPILIEEAQKALIKLIGTADLKGKKFLDIGSGSGLHSLAAKKLGAEVYSFDYDKDSVSCTQFLKDKYFPNSDDWNISEGSALDEDFIRSLGQFDIVYSWGVLHHTGNMYGALELADLTVAENGILILSIYNDQGMASKIWRTVKKTYNMLPSYLRFLILWPAFIRLWGPTTIRNIICGRPFQTWRNYKKNRGMSPWIDVIDWVGGYPFEVAKRKDITDFYERKGYTLKTIISVGSGHGCNEYVFIKGRACTPF